MAFTFKPQGTWTALNKEATRLFAPQNEKADVRVFGGAAHALLEFTLGFREQFPLRKKYFYFKDLDPHFSLAATALARAGLQVTALDVKSLNVGELVASFDREFGFIFFPLDNPVTGELYPFAELEKTLAEKSFPRLIAAYAPHRLHGMKETLERNEAWMYALGGDCAVLALGDRLRFAAPVAPALSPVTSERLQAAAKSYRRDADEAAVRAFECKELGGAKPLFDSSFSARTFDRAVVYWEDMDGHAFLDALARELGEPLRAPGMDSRFETTSLSRWGGIRTMEWLHSRGLRPEQIRGLVVIDARLLSPELEKKFVAARASVLQSQNG